MKRGDLIYHRVHQRDGIVHATPRAHSTAVQCILDGNTSPQYYDQADVLPRGADGKPLAPVVNPQNEPRGVFTPVPPATNGQDPEPTLASLLVIHADLRRRMDRLDALVQQARVEDILRRALEKVRLPAFTIPASPLPPLKVNCYMAPTAEVEKIKADTAQALRAAERLIARGAL